MALFFEKLKNTFSKIKYFKTKSDLKKKHHAYMEMKKNFQKRILIGKFQFRISLNVMKKIFELLKKKWCEGELYRYETKLAAIQIRIKYFQKAFFGFKKKVISSKVYDEVQKIMIQKRKKKFFEICKRKFNKTKKLKKFITLWESMLENESLKKGEFFTKWKEYNRKLKKKKMIMVYNRLNIKKY